MCCCGHVTDYKEAGGFHAEMCLVSLLLRDHEAQNYYLQSNFNILFICGLIFWWIKYGPLCLSTDVMQ